MIEIRQTETFATWFTGLRDKRAKARIEARIDRMARGNFGDVKPASEGISELRIDYGPGYRLYLVQRDAVILLVGGDKSTQAKDIKRAKKLAREL